MAYNLKITGTAHSVDVDDGAHRCLGNTRRVRHDRAQSSAAAPPYRGACTVHIDGVATRSCITTVDSIGDSAITTIEAIGETPQGGGTAKSLARPRGRSMRLLSIRPTDVAAAALLTETPKPTDEDINSAMSGNVCRCGTYQRIRAAIKQAAEA